MGGGDDKLNVWIIVYVIYMFICEEKINIIMPKKEVELYCRYIISLHQCP